jgi:hypothetical protein
MSDKSDEIINRNVAKLKLANEYTQADNIIRYLTAPEDSDIELTDREKKRLDILKEIHAFRMRYNTKADIINIIKKLHNLKQSQCYALVKECEYVFGTLDTVSKNYERSWLLELSRKNIQLAFESRKSEVISRALKEHYIIAGLGEVTVEMPDFSALEPNVYNIVIPDDQKAMLMEMLNKGFFRGSDLVPHPNVTIDITAKDVTDEQK